MSMLKKLFVLPIFLLSQNVCAEQTNVFCAPENGEFWYWAEDSNQQQVTTTGSSGESYLSDGKYFSYFTISSNEYNRLKQFCDSGHVPQPAENRFSNWSIFQITHENGSYNFAPGKYSSNEQVGHSAYRL